MKDVKLFGILCCFSAGLLVAQPAADPAATARKALDSLLGARYSELNPVFTPEMQKAFPDAELAKLGAQIKSFGSVNKIDDPARQAAGPNTIVVIPVEFAKETINFRCIVNSR
ncbi:MAG TPA: hypothetical protein VMA31_10510, partial [Bryobacteraceae bacterium]|nr:hypothetical protein [Bryobacteraceae bacterium]